MFINRSVSFYRSAYKTFLIAVLAVSCLEAWAQSPLAGLPFVRTFSTVEYKAGIQNWSITQDKRGILYVANNFGLLEFDGVQWTTYPVTNGTKVRSVVIDKRGRIYVGSQGDFGYFHPDSNGRLTYKSLADSIPAEKRNFDEAWSIYIEKEKVYFCTFSNIYVYDGKSIEVIQDSSPLDLSFIVRGELYVNRRHSGLSVLKGSELRTLPGGEFFKGISISSVLPLDNENLVISTFRDGIFTLERGQVKPWKASLQSLLRNANVNCMIRLKSGNLAVGTQNDGVMVLNQEGELVMHLTRGKGLENRTVLALYEDDLNNLWVGQNNNIAHVESGSPFTIINEQKGLPGTGYSAFLDNDRFYLGTNTGLYARHRNSTSDFALIENTGGQVYHVGKYNGKILAGHHKGAFLIDDKPATMSSEPGSWVFLKLNSHPDIIVEGTYSGLQIYRWKNEKWVFEKKLRGFDESSRVMAEDEDGRIWVTHGYKGAYRIRLSSDGDSIEEVSFYGKQKGFPSNLLINVFKVRNELLFTSEAGVFKYNRNTDSFVPDDLFTRLLGPGVQIWTIQEDSFGNIYFAGTTHIGVLRKNAIGEYSLEENAFSKVRRFLNDDLVNITILQNNEVIFGARDGFIHYDPARKNPLNKNFNSIIRNVSVTSNGDSVIFYGNHDELNPVTKKSSVLLPYTNNSLRFSYAATAYEGNEARQYQFYLENFDDQWSGWTEQTNKEYTNLKEGKYTFQVRARNDSGQISSLGTFSFTINPPWYRSIFALIVYSLFTLTLLYLGFIVLDKKYQREQKMMEEKQQLELSEKENEIQKISIQSQEEITRLQNEKLEADLRHMNTELATATMHILNKNEFITGIKNNLNQIIKKNGTPESRKELVQITKDIESNISADSDWDHFQFHFDRVHGDFTNRFKAAFPGLSPQEIKLSAYLRMNMSTKEIAQLLNISIRGVEISRYRLRKKLHLDRQQNLQDFILNF